MAALKAAQDVGETSAAIAIKLARMDGLPDGWAVSLKARRASRCTRTRRARRTATRGPFAAGREGA